MGVDTLEGRFVNRPCWAFLYARGRFQVKYSEKIVVDLL